MRLHQIYILLFGLLFYNISFGQNTSVERDTLEVEINRMVQELHVRLEELEEKEDSKGLAFNNMQLGLSFGFNYYTNAPKGYFIQADSSIGIFGESKGYSGMLSALLGYKISKKHSILVNIPLGDLSGNASQAIGVFNKKIAGGLGYGYNIQNLSIIGVINMFPYEELAYDVVSDKKYEGEPYTILDISDLPKQSKVSPSLTVGICYNFLKPKNFLH
ncbi:MAG: hypothetical protein KJP21_06540 [Bacteroidia bacterium]|nr:hypothetical protein [Bacteroidia bacterium]NNJ55424.1 hypothetical protein [Bacteroidia bacterium]